jgi:hypothetical protein
MCSVWSDPRFLVSVASAVITLGAVLAALFLRELRACLRPPRLEMALAHENGLAVTALLISEAPRKEKTRYYHLRICNPRRKADAVNGVSVTLLRVERKGKDGDYHEAWSGDIPIAWRHERPDSVPERRIVGTWGDIDLCSVVKDKWLQLHVKVCPIDLTIIYRVGDEMPVDIALTVQARGNEVDSEIQRWRAFWDGEWADGDHEMRKHFWSLSCHYRLK